MAHARSVILVLLPLLPPACDKDGAPGPDDGYEEGAEEGAEEGGEEGSGKAESGTPGGLCLAPEGTCTDGVCNREENYCYDETDPCRGFECGGVDRGSCSVAGGKPSCACLSGFENETFSLYCCPADGSDELCPP